MNLNTKTLSWIHIINTFFCEEDFSSLDIGILLTHELHPYRYPVYCVNTTS